jgi:hypothetical protein
VGLPAWTPHLRKACYGPLSSSTTIAYLINREANMRRTVCREFTYVEYREPFQMRFLQASPRSIPLFRADAPT